MAELLRHITFNDVLEIFGMIAVVAGGVKIIINLFAPFKRLKEEVEKIKGLLKSEENRLKQGDERMNEIDKKIEHQDRALSIIGLTISDMIEHQITGNDTDALRARQKELDEFFYGGDK